MCGLRASCGEVCELCQSQAQSIVYCTARDSLVGCNAVNSIVNYPAEVPLWGSTVGAPMSCSSVEFSVSTNVVLPCGTPMWGSSAGLQGVFRGDPFLGPTGGPSFVVGSTA